MRLPYLDHHQGLRLSTEVQLGQLLLPDELHVVRKVLLKEVHHVLHRVQFLELALWHEQSDGPAAVLVGQCNHHEVAPWPDVQVLLGHRRLVGGGGRNGQLQVAMLDEGLAVIESRCRNDLSADSTVGPICSHDVVSRSGDGRTGLGTGGETEGHTLQSSEQEEEEELLAIA